MSRHYGCIQGTCRANRRFDAQGLVLEVSTSFLKVPNQISPEGRSSGSWAQRLISPQRRVMGGLCLPS